MGDDDAKTRKSADVTTRDGSPAAQRGGADVAHARARTAPPPGGTSRLGELPERLADFGEIARGGMGAIHRVYDASIRRYVAAKLLDEELAQEPEAMRRFLDEAQITGQLDHPNIVPVHELVMGDGGVPRWFLMKLVEGETLATRLAPEQAATRTDDELHALLEIFGRVCEAVAFAHGRGVVHRDLKPSNVMIGSHGQVYVMDWGVAQLIPLGEDRMPRPGRVSITRGDAPDEAGIVVGTPSYMSPEQAWGRLEALDPRADVFSLGAILYHLLTGRPPYQRKFGSGTPLTPGAPPTPGAPEGPSAMELARRGDIEPPEQVAPGIPIPPALSEIAMRALDRDPARRPAGALELKEEIERCLRGGLWLSRRRFATGATVMREGELGDVAYIVLSGRCEVFKSVEGRAVRLREMGPGEVFGETAILTNRPRTASVVAMDELTVLVVTRESLARELREPSWIGALVRALAERFRDLDERMATAPPSEPAASPDGGAER
jgi:serine/threonine-protein kinase